MLYHFFNNVVLIVCRGSSRKIHKKNVAYTSLNCRMISLQGNMKIIGDFKYTPSIAGMLKGQITLPCDMQTSQICLNV